MTKKIKIFADTAFLDEIKFLEKKKNILMDLLQILR